MLIRNKVAAFLVIGGQDNVQAVVGQMMMFFGELGFSFPQFPFIGHSRGWSAEDMEKNVAEVRASAELRRAHRLVESMRRVCDAGAADAAPARSREAAARLMTSIPSNCSNLGQSCAALAS